jgi:hypothetical protein
VGKARLILRGQADVDPFVLHLFAALAEKERAMISARTIGVGDMTFGVGAPELAGEFVQDGGMTSTTRAKNTRSSIPASRPLSPTPKELTTMSRQTPAAFNAAIRFRVP